MLGFIFGVFPSSVRFFRFPRLLFLDGCGGKELCGEEMETIVQPRSQGQAAEEDCVRGNPV